MPKNCKLVRKGKQCIQKCEDDKTGEPIEREVPMSYCDKQD